MATILFYALIVYVVFLAVGLLAGFYAAKRIDDLVLALTYGAAAVCAVVWDSWWPLPAGLVVAHLLKRIAISYWRHETGQTIGDDDTSTHVSERVALCAECGTRRGYPAYGGRCAECDAERFRRSTGSPAASNRIAWLLFALRRRLVGFLDTRSQIVALLFGAGLIYWGCVEYRLGSGASQGPEHVELARLEDGYISENKHLSIGRHLRAYEAIVYTARGRNRRDPEVRHALYPLLSADSAPSDVSEIKVLVQTSRFHRVSELPDSNEVSPTITGLLVDRGSSLASREQELIRARFPKTNFDDLLVLEEGREPWRTSSALLVVAGGIAAIAVSLAATFLSRGVPTGNSEGAVSSATGQRKQPWSTDDSPNARHELRGSSSILGSAVGHHLQLFALTVAGGLSMFAGVTATWAILALFSKSWCLIAGAAVLATPFNVYFYYAVRRERSPAPDDDCFGLDRASWLVLAWVAYALGAAGALWAMMGW